MTAGAGDGKQPTAVQGQIVFGKDDAVNVGFSIRREAAAITQAVLGFRRQRYKYLVCLTDIDGCGGFAVDRHAVQHQLNFVGFIRIHNYGAVRQCAAEDIGSFLIDGNGAAGNRNIAAVAGNGISVQHDGNAVAFRIGSIQIPIGENRRSHSFLRFFRSLRSSNCLCRRRCCRGDCQRLLCACGAGRQYHGQTEQQRDCLLFFHIPFLLKAPQAHFPVWTT